MKTYISVNIVSQALLLVLAIKKHGCDDIKEIEQLKLPYGVNRDAAIAFAHQCEWLKICNRSIVFTHFGETIADSFNGVMIDQSLWQAILAKYIKTSEPAWAQRIPYGRKEAYLIMTIEEQRCFDEAGLMDSTDAAVIDWWDSIAEYERAIKASSLVDIGREGERLTVLFEQERTGFTPEWISIESNLAGYDILSHKEGDSEDNILIEVKSSNKAIDDAFCIITRHEWETAQRKNNIERYFFYLWDISKKSPVLAIVKPAEMQPYIPVDSGVGKWEEVSIPFSAFEDAFFNVSLAF